MPGRRPILVVDDDDDIREAIRDTLAPEGYRTVDAADGRAGLEYLRAHPAPGLILLDWNMAPMSGAQFMAELRREPALADVPVVLLTADIRAEEGARGIEFTGTLKKPVDLEALFALVHRHCD
jgi:CheY-like chemotaxis protein